MSPLLRKEVRALLPPWLLALSLAILPIWLVWPSGYGIPASNAVLSARLGYWVYAPFALGILLLSLTPFGQELNWGTFSVLLAQPVSRARIWRVKTLLLAMALLLVFAVFLISNQARFNSAVAIARVTDWLQLLNRPGGDRQLELDILEVRHDILFGSLMIGGLVTAAGFAGGLWAPLIFRQFTAAFWFTLLVPLGLGLFSGFFGEMAACLMVGLYSVAGFVCAHKQFQSVEDTQWTGGVVAMPDWTRAAAGARTDIGRRKKRRFAAVLGKELQTQYINLLLVGALVLLHLILVAVRRLNADYLAAHRSVAMILEAFPVLWLALPLLIGSVAIAEERKLGTFESLCCLPLARWAQFSLKLCLALALGVTFGALVPAGIEYLGFLTGLNPANSPFLGNDSFSAIRPAVYAALAISFLAFYGSSPAHNTLQALGAGLLACIIAGLITEIADHPPAIWGSPLWGARLLGDTLWPIAILTATILAYRNYRRVKTTGQILGQNGLALLIVLVATTAISSAIYHRAWEAWMPIEPRHTYFRSGPGVQDFSPGGRHLPHSKLQASFSQFAAVLPDGRLWLRQRPQKLVKQVQGQVTYFVPERSGSWHSGFVPGSNWRDVACSSFGCFAVQEDGSLWDLTAVQPRKRAAEKNLKRVGDSNDWLQITAGGTHFSGVKSDGTVWEWGWRYQGHQPSPADLGVPSEVGTDTDWIAVVDSGQNSIAVKADGTVWRWGWIQRWSGDNLSHSEVHRDQQKWLAFPHRQRPIYLSSNGLSLVAVCDDGTLWLGGYALGAILGQDRAVSARTNMVQFGEDKDWEQAAFAGTLRGFGLKRNGTLVKWDSDRVIFHISRWQVPLSRTSDYTIWTGICPYRNAFLALANDDMLCLWGDPEENAFFDQNGPDPRRLLMPSRIQARKFADLSR